MEEKKKEILKVDTMLRVFMGELVLKGWAYLGVISHPETEEIKSDIEQAKLAIDAIERLLELRKNFLSEKEIKEMQLSLSNLKLNYVNKKNEKNK